MIGTRLKQLRKSRGYTQESLAEIFGTGKNQIWRWETGQNKPGIDVVEKLARILEVPAGYLLGDDTEIDFNFDESKMPPDEKLLLARWRRRDVKGLLKLVTEVAPESADELEKILTSDDQP